MKEHNLSNEEWERIYSVIKNVVNKIPCNPCDKEDLIHDVLKHVIKRLKTSYKEEGKLEAWVKILTKNFYIDRINEKRKINMVYFEDIKANFRSPQYANDDLRSTLAIEIVIESIEELEYLDKEIIKGKLNKESNDEISIRLKKCRNTIKRHWAKIKKTLPLIINRKFIERYGEPYIYIR